MSGELALCAQHASPASCRVAEQRYLYVPEDWQVRNSATQFKRPDCEQPPTDLDRRDVAGGGIVLLMTLAAALVYPRLPKRMAVHFSAGGQPDGYLARPLAAALLQAEQAECLGACPRGTSPGVVATVLVLFKLVPAIDPLGGNIERFQRYYDFFVGFAAGILAYVHGLVLAYNVGYRFDMTTVVVPLLAVTFVVAGYVIENARQNWFVGIRTPWTRSGEEVWNRTHQRAGVLFKLAGAVSLLALAFPEYFEVIVVAPVVAATLFATVCSSVLYRRKQRGRLQ